MGDDYVFSVPDMYFTNLDKLIYYVNKEVQFVQSESERGSLFWDTRTQGTQDESGSTGSRNPRGPIRFRTQGLGPKLVIEVESLVPGPRRSFYWIQDPLDHGSIGFGTQGSKSGHLSHGLCVPDTFGFWL